MQSLYFYFLVPIPGRPSRIIYLTTFTRYQPPNISPIPPMSRTHYGPPDPESASFLHGESKLFTSQEGEESPAQHRAPRWNRLSSPVTLPRVLVYLVIFSLIIISLTLAVILVSLNGMRKEMNPLLLQSILTVPTHTVIFRPDESYNVDLFGPDGLESPWQNLAPRMSPILSTSWVLR